MWISGHCFSYEGKRKEDLIDQVGYKYSEIILEFQGQQDLNVWFLRICGLLISGLF